MNGIFDDRQSYTAAQVGILIGSRADDLTRAGKKAMEDLGVPSIKISGTNFYSGIIINQRIQNGVILSGEDDEEK